ncbi:hypothetical protein [Streptomyces sp. NRRL S-350]|uniref:hypothetical protein n=1 Tax=Streptomyces sp. NRRL S-350 TaxID=1463902 RepID=UPI00068F8AEA|nr:hypothetical protein [Streptomyces sp. NRRL S-350]
MTQHAPAHTRLVSRFFADDEPVYASMPGRLMDGLDMVFGRTDAWPADCLPKPANLVRARWKCVLPTDAVWNLTARELAFAMLNPTHTALREAGLFLRIEQWSPRTVFATCEKLRYLVRWASTRNLPGDLGAWQQSDWQDFIDERVVQVRPATVRQYVEVAKRLAQLAPVLTFAQGLQDPWPGMTLDQVAAFSKPKALSTDTIPPAVWWPLLRAAWAYIDRIGPQVLDHREAEAERIAALPPLEPARRNPEATDELLERWLADPANLVPVHARPHSGAAVGTPAWGPLSLAVTGGRTIQIFTEPQSGSPRARSRKAKVQAVVAQGRTVVLPARRISTVLGVDYTEHKARAGQAQAEHRRALDERLDAWLANRGNLIPVHTRPFRGRPTGEPVWAVLETLVYGGYSERAFRTDGPAALQRVDKVRTVAQDPARRTPHHHRQLHELRTIRAACYIFITALSAMRDSEVQEIQRGALIQHYGAPAIASTQIKDQRGRPRRHWWIIEPVARAVALAERLSWHETHIFAALHPGFVRHDDGQGFHAGQDIDHFIAAVNRDARALGLDPIPDALVRPHMFRRTMAVITRLEPDGEIANGLQLKHASRRALANAVTAAYGQTDKQWAKEFNTELATAAAERLVAMLRARRDGQQVAIGPGAHRLHTGLDKVNNQLEAAGTVLRATAADQRLEVSLLREEFADLHLGTINHCLWNQATAECQNALPADRRGNQPLIGACQPARCRNSVLTIKHAPIWRLEEQDLTQRLAGKLPAPRRRLIEDRLADVRAVTAQFDRLDHTEENV